MKLDTSGFDKERLAQCVNAEYGLDVVSLAFVPVGEDSYSYDALGRDGSRCFVRAQSTPDETALEQAYAIVDRLHTHHGLSQVVAPIPNRRGTFTCHHEACAVAVFPFVEGVRAFDRPLSDEGLADVAALMATVHRSGPSLADLLPRQETFHNPFAAPIQHALQVVEALDRSANPFQRQVQQLLCQERMDILAALETMERLGSEARALDLDRVLTHGDPNTANVIVDPAGRLHMVDWDDVALGPPERDLVFFADERFELFLRSYLVAYGQVRLHAPVFAFYQYRWALQEIADYSTRILFRNTTPQEDRHAWAELTQYLPIPHRNIRASVDQIAATIRRTGMMS